MYIPKDAILMLSGVSCVGKTTTAYEIVKNYPEFRRVSEYDLMRTVVRTAYEYLAEEAYIDKNKLKSKYNALFKSITSNNFEITKLQSEQFFFEEPVVTISGCNSFLSDHSSASSGYCDFRSLKPVKTFFPAQ